MESRLFKTRFAPSPTGLLHLGNIRTALFNYLLARHAGGTFLLRLEDTDAMRDHEKYAQALMQDLRWMGLEWQEGPEVGGELGPYLQSQRDAVYKEFFAILQKNKSAYSCFCSEQELAIARKTALAAGLPPRYSGKCRELVQAEVEARRAKGEPATLRFRVAEGKRIEFEDKVRGSQIFNSDDIGDFVIQRSDGTPAFFFCNAIDDALMEVTLVVRGEDHLANTPRQIMLLQTLGLPVPEYAHIAMVVGDDGAPLSKRTSSNSVEVLRNMGYLPSAIYNYLARLGHTYDANAFMEVQSLADNFDIARLHRAPARFDERQMRYWQREAIMCLPSSAIHEWVGEAVRKIVPADKFDEFIEAVRGNISFPVDALRWAQIVFTDKLTVSCSAQDAIAAAGKNFFDEACRAVEKHGPDFKAVSDALKHKLALSGKPLFQPLRAALTGELDGPEMARLLPLISAGRARERFSRFST